MTSPAITRALRIIAAARAGEAPAPVDALAMAEAVNDALETGCKIEEALGLRGVWRGKVRQARRLEVSSDDLKIAPGESLRDASRRLHRRLVVDRQRGAANQLLEATNGKVPSPGTLRKLLSKQ